MLPTTIVLCSLTEILSAVTEFEINKSCINDCERAGNILVCERCIPNTLPSRIEEFRVINNSEAVTASTFNDSSWYFVQSVDISDSITKHLENTFPLKKLTHLGLHLEEGFVELKKIHVDSLAFSEFDFLEQFNVSNCDRFSYEAFYEMVKNLKNFPKLKT